MKLKQNVEICGAWHQWLVSCLERLLSGVSLLPTHNFRLDELHEPNEIHIMGHGREEWLRVMLHSIKSVSIGITSLDCVMRAQIECAARAEEWENERTSDLFTNQRQCVSISTYRIHAHQIHIFALFSLSLRCRVVLLVFEIRVCT